jgi:hypothetical protein
MKSKHDRYELEKMITDVLIHRVTANLDQRVYFLSKIPRKPVAEKFAIQFYWSKRGDLFNLGDGYEDDETKVTG